MGITGGGEIRGGGQVGNGVGCVDKGREGKGSRRDKDTDGGKRIRGQRKDIR